MKDKTTSLISVCPVKAFFLSFGQNGKGSEPLFGFTTIPGLSESFPLTYCPSDNDFNRWKVRENLQQTQAAVRKLTRFLVFTTKKEFELL